jgi:hypothetical protein
MAYSKAKLKSSGDKASPCFRPFSTTATDTIDKENQHIHREMLLSIKEEPGNSNNTSKVLRPQDVKVQHHIPVTEKSPRETGMHKLQHVCPTQELAVVRKVLTSFHWSPLTDDLNGSKPL